MRYQQSFSLALNMLHAKSILEMSFWRTLAASSLTFFVGISASNDLQATSTKIQQGSLDPFRSSTRAGENRNLLSPNSLLLSQLSILSVVASLPLSLYMSLQIAKLVFSSISHHGSDQVDI